MTSLNLEDNAELKELANGARRIRVRLAYWAFLVKVYIQFRRL